MRVHGITAIMNGMFALTGAAFLFFCASPTHADATASTLNRIRATGEIRIGYGDTAPFSYQTSDDRVVGYSIDICSRVVDILKRDLNLPQLQTKYVRRTPANRIQLLNDGLMDIECNASTNTRARRKSVAFTYSHFYAATRYVSLAKLNLRTLEDLAGRSVSVALGTVNVGQINDVNREKRLSLSVVPTDSLQSAFAMVAGGQVSAFAMDDVLLSAMIAHSGRPEDFSLSTELVSGTQPYGFMVRLGDDAFKDAVNAALLQVYSDPAMPEIYRRWFELPIPGQQIPLGLPMSDTLKAALANPAEEPDSL